MLRPGDSAFFRQEAQKPAGTVRIFQKKPNSRRGRCVFSPGSRIPGGNCAYFPENALSTLQIVLFLKKKPNSRCGQRVFSPGSRNCSASSAFFTEKAEIAMQQRLFFARKLCLQGSGAGRGKKERHGLRGRRVFSCETLAVREVVPLKMQLSVYVIICLAYPTLSSGYTGSRSTGRRI